MQVFRSHLSFRNVEGNKAGPRPTSDIDDLVQLIQLFPDIDRKYAKMCLQNYSHNRVASVTEKLLDRNFNHYPKLVFSGSFESNLL